MRKEDLLEMFKYNPFKVRILNEKVNTPTTTVYRCGPLIDLCRGPHVRHTGKIKALKITKVLDTSSQLFKSFFIFNDFRTLLLIGKEKQMQKLSNEFMVSVFLILNN